MRVTPRDSNYIGLQHRFCVLRPELVASFVEAESIKKSPTQKVPDVPTELNGQESDDIASGSDATAASVEEHDKSDETPVSTPAESNDSTAEILFNPNVFTEYKLAGSPEVAGLIKHLPHLWDLFSAEIIVRSAKHVVKDILRQSPDHNIAPAVAHFLNCFFGKVLAASTKGSTGSPQSKTQKKSSQSASSKKGQSAFSQLTSDGVWSDIKEFAKHKYQFEAPDDVRVGAKRVAVLRNLCQKVGITIAARKYDLHSTTPFQPSDILNLQPVVKHSVPTCTDARKLMEAGKIRMAEGTLNEAYALFSEAFSLLQQINGPMHKDAANCCRYLAMVLYHAGDTAGAIVQQHRELIINERCLGLDHPDTAHSYGNMALFYHGLNQTELALRHMSRTLLLLSLASGPDHPDVAATLINVAMMYQDASNMSTALRYLQEALKKNERLLGPGHIQTAVCYHALAIAFSCMGAYKLSVQHETKTHDILVKQLGSDDSRTKDSENWLNTFKGREQQVIAQKQKGQGTVPSANAVEFLKAHPGLFQAMKAAAIQSGGDGPANVNRVRGGDERAAKAAAEARKTAVARGVNLRNGPAASVSDINQILNLINSAASASAASSGNAQATESEVPQSNGPALNGAKEAKDTSRPSAKADGQAPVGLGASLELKKQKSKQKA
ncbi:unnamed protein product [Triticum turgidum subsp. durum]|uniref:CLU central domain-containing protein n=1 Tax=Triticum turgidum subsp. durum TaxID=4567 RepID=A0A9R1B258_TRITD|nr:unnamed protein product [Triticum turgidum subsp. durum]